MSAPRSRPSGHVDGHRAVLRALAVAVHQPAGPWADDAGHAALQAVVLLVLGVGEEDVAVVDRPLDVEDLDLAEPALPAPAVVHHVRAAGLQGLEHGHVAGHRGLQPEPWDTDPERLGGEPAAGAEGLEPQVRGPSGRPGP